MGKLFIAVFVVLVLHPAAALSRVIEIFPTNADATCNEEFENIANTLVAGDTLILHDGEYSQNCRRLISGRNGTATQPIVITAAVGARPILTRPGNANFSYDQNNIEIENSSYLVIRGISFRGGDSGVRFMGVSHHITFEENEIYETGNNALTMHSGNSDFMIVRKNHIHHTGLYNLGSTEGEGMYLGCHTNTCRVTNSLIEGNYIHHLRSTSGGGNDGIEVKMGSHGNVIRNNVIHDTNIGTQYPCIFVYGGGAGINTVEGNAVWNCGEGIYAVSDVVVRNNIVMHSGLGISSYPHAVVSGIKNLTIVNNTIYGSDVCLFVRWSAASNVILANNAIYCPGSTAVDGTGLANAQAAVSANYFEGSLSGATAGGVAFLNGGTATAAFTNPTNADLWPSQGSILRERADFAHSPADDFNGTVRTSPADVGAYETNGVTNNPGWQIQPGFKSQATQDNIAPTVVISSPNSGSTVARRSKVTIIAGANDNVGVTRVQFFVNGSLLCTDGTVQYSCVWKVPSGKSNRTYNLTAKAYDAAGNVGSSATVTVSAR